MYRSMKQVAPPGLRDLLWVSPGSTFQLVCAVSPSTSGHIIHKLLMKPLVKLVVEGSILQSTRDELPLACHISSLYAILSDIWKQTTLTLHIFGRQTCGTHPHPGQSRAQKNPSASGDETYQPDSNPKQRETQQSRERAHEKAPATAT